MLHFIQPLIRRLSRQGLKLDKCRVILQEPLFLPKTENAKTHPARPQGKEIYLRAGQGDFLLVISAEMVENS